MKEKGIVLPESLGDNARKKIMKKSDIIKKIKFQEADAVLLGAPYEKTVSDGEGASRRPKAICDMLKYQVEEWDSILKKHTCREVDIAEKTIKLQNLEPGKMVKAVTKEALAVMKQNKFLITLGGEHTVSLGSVAAAKIFFGKTTVFQIDAHADLRDDNHDYENNSKKVTKFSHSCIMRRVRELGCSIVQTGIRSMSPIEHDYIIREGIEKNIFYTPVKASRKEIISRCPTKKVYLTIDVDGFDPSVMPATGTPEPGGLSWNWTLGLLRELFSKREVVGFDIVEVAPRRGDSRTEFAAAKLLYHLIGLKF